MHSVAHNGRSDEGTTRLLLHLPGMIYDSRPMGLERGHCNARLHGDFNHNHPSVDMESDM